MSAWASVAPPHSARPRAADSRERFIGDDLFGVGVEEGKACDGRYTV
jgi:hypothetical protein